MMMTSHRVLLVAAGIALLARASLAQELTFDDIRKSDMQTEFRTDCSPAEAPANYPELSKIANTRSGVHLYLDPGSIALSRFGQAFNYTFYVEARTTWLKCGTTVESSGAFLDRYERVHFTIAHDRVTEDGAFNLPIHNIGKADFLEITTSDSPIHVNLSRAPGVELRLHNLLPDMALIVDTPLQAAAAHPENWHALEAAKLPGGDTIRIPPGETVAVHVPLQPQKVPAILATLTSVKPDGLHDKLSFNLTYATDLGGASRSRHAEMGVRFVPSIISLIIALITGSLLGTSAAQLLPNVWKGWSTATKKAGRALVFSLVADLFAMLLVALGSRFVIIQFDLDPWQFLPTLFIGFIVSGGKDVLTYLGFSRASTKDQPETAAVAQ
jgi:hypothetical protein